MKVRKDWYVEERTLSKAGMINIFEQGATNIDETLQADLNPQGRWSTWSYFENEVNTILLEFAEDIF